MNEYRDISEFLESDKGAMEFYNSLPTSLRQKMHKGGAEAFRQLYESSFKEPKGERDCLLSAASANDCTGLIRQGSDRSEEDWLRYRELEPFGPPQL